MQREKKSWITAALLILFISLCVTFYCQIPLLTNEFAINEDSRQVIYFYPRFQEAFFFKNDPITEVVSRFNPYGVSAFYFIIGIFLDPLKFTKILPFITCAISAIFMFKLGSRLRNQRTAFLSGLIFIFISWSRRGFEFFGTGDGADFSIPLTIIFLYYVIGRNFGKSFIILFLLSFFYPPLFLICALTLAITLVSGTFDSGPGSGKRKRLLMLAAVLAIFFIPLLKYSDNKLALVDLAQMKGMEEFYPGGRMPVFFPSLYLQLTNQYSGIALDYTLKWLLIISITLALLLKKESLNIPAALWNFCLSSFSFFILAYIFMYRLSGPARYMRYSFPVFLILFIALNTDKLLEKIKPVLLRHAALGAALLFICLSFIPALRRYFVIAPYPGLYRFISSLPQDALIAGHPMLMNDIPPFSKKRVFISEETSLPYYKDFYPVIRKRTYDFFDIYYSGSLEKIYAFCRDSGITHLVVNKNHFSSGYFASGKFYLNPFNKHILDLVRERPASFALMQVPQGRKVFEEGDIFVIETKSLDNDP